MSAGGPGKVVSSIKDRVLLKNRTTLRGYKLFRKPQAAAILPARKTPRRCYGFRIVT
jgi:hypothetical protein